MTLTELVAITNEKLALERAVKSITEAWRKDIATKNELAKQLRWLKDQQGK